MNMVGAYGPSGTMLGYLRQRQADQIAATDAAQRQQMNQFKLSRLPTEAAQADWEFQEKQKQAQSLDAMAADLKAGMPVWDAAVKNGVRLSPEQGSVLENRQREYLAKMEKEASQTAAAQGIAESMAPMPVARSEGGVTPLGAIRAAGEQYDTDIEAERALAGAYPKEYTEYALGMRKQEAANQAALERARMTASGKSSKVNDSRAERDRARLIKAKYPDLEEGSPEWVQIESGYIEEERFRTLNGEPPKLIKLDRAAQRARAEGDPEIAEGLEAQAEKIAIEAGFRREVVWNPVTQEMDVKYIPMAAIKAGLRGGNTTVPTPAPQAGAAPQPIAGGEGYSPGVGKPRPAVPAAVTEGLAGIQTTINQMGKIQNFIDTVPGKEVLENATGPAEPVREFMDKWGIWYNENADQLRTDIEHLRDIVYAMSGKALTQEEIKQWEKRLPSMGDKGKRFLIKWNSATEYLNSLLSSRKQMLEQGGYRIEGDKLVPTSGGGTNKGGKASDDELLKRMGLGR